jgi:hypothetical protein
MSSFPLAFGTACDRRRLSIQRYTLCRLKSAMLSPASAILAKVTGSVLADEKFGSVWLNFTARAG